MKKLIALFAMSCFLLSACAGYEGHPVATIQPEDVRMSCHDLDNEIAYNHARMDDLAPHTDKSGANTTMIVLGGLLVPLIFLDLKDGEKKEYMGYMQRNDHLKALRADRNCRPDPMTVRDKKMGFAFSDK
jgi:hypothetical protein